MIIFYFIFFLFGLAVGSFLNSIIYRLQTGETFLFARSCCPHCKHILDSRDLIPVLSFLILSRKCRYCQKPISLQYPLVELATGILFILIFNFQFSIFNECPISNFQFLIFLYYLLIACFLIIIFVYDLKHFIIPDKVIYPAIGIACLYNIYQLTINNQQLVINSFLSALGATAFFLVIVLISGGKWMGIGDIKLAFLIGLFLGWPNILVVLFLSFFIGGLIGAGLIISGKKTLKSEVPFGPFLVSGTFIALFWGRELINWYLNLFT